VNLGNSVRDKSGSTLGRRVTPKMADIPVPGYQAFWTDTYNKLKSEYQQLIGQFPDADAQWKQLFKVVCDIKEMERYTPATMGESEQVIHRQHGRGKQEELLQSPHWEDPI
jgi:hypothetical protein